MARLKNKAKAKANDDNYVPPPPKGSPPKRANEAPSINTAGFFEVPPPPLGSPPKRRPYDPTGNTAAQSSHEVFRKYKDPKLNKKSKKTQYKFVLPKYNCSS